MTNEEAVEILESRVRPKTTKMVNGRIKNLPSVKPERPELTDREQEIIDAIRTMGLFRTKYSNEEVEKLVNKLI